MNAVSELVVVYVATLAGGGYDALLTDGSRVRYEPPYSLTVILPSAETTERLQRVAERPSKPYRSRRSMEKLKEEARLRKRAYKAYTAKELAAELNVSETTMRRWLKGVA